MNNKTFKRILSLILSLALIGMAPAFVLAAEDAPDAPSAWASVDIYMAEAAYGLGGADTYSGFRSGLDTEKFIPVYQGLADTYGLSGSLAPGEGQLTRGEVITALYGLVTGDKAGTTDNALTFFVGEKLMNGRSSGDYELDKICSVEEMLVFAVRIYEHLAYRMNRDAKGFFWEVRGGADKLYLLGSIHLNDGSIYPLSKAVEKAFAGAANLVVEVDVLGMADSEYAYLDEVGYIVFESGQTIRDYLSADTYALYRAVLESLGVPQATYDFLKPWYANLLLQGMGASYGQEEVLLGVDMYFLRKAHAAEKNIVELEGSGYQFDLFDSLSPEIQEIQLYQTLAGFLASDANEAEGGEAAEDAMREVYAALLEIVRTGDDEAMNAMLGFDRAAKDPVEIEFNTLFYSNRNKAMANKIEGYLKGARDEAGGYFVVVGAAHMAGKDGLVALLTDAGYQVVRIK